jgi:hypothetical protein
MTSHQLTADLTSDLTADLTYVLENGKMITAEAPNEKGWLQSIATRLCVLFSNPLTMQQTDEMTAAATLSETDVSRFNELNVWHLGARGL